MESTLLDIPKKTFIEALKKSLGVVMAASKKTGISRATHYHWYKTDPEYKSNIDDIKEDAIDFVESSLFEQIKDGNTTATIFYLKTIGKERGYVERQEYTGKNGGPIETRDLSNLSDDELRRIIEGAGNTGAED